MSLSTRWRAARSARRRGTRNGRSDALLTVGVMIGIVAALLPVTRVIAPGAWIWGALALSAATMATGFLLRRTRMSAVGISAVELALTIGVVTVVFLRETALWGIIPVFGSVDQAAGLVVTASEEIFYSAAPMVPTPALSFLVVGAAGLFTIAVDHIALTARMPLLAGVALFTVSLIPALAVPSAVNLWSFALLAAAVLLMLRAETRGREPRGGRASGASAVAAGIGALALVATLLITPSLPQPGPRVASGSGTAGIDASLSLGQDLRRPEQIEVLRMRSTAPLPPYLRVATLSEFTGAVWEPDRTWSLPLEGGAAFGDVETGPGIEVADYSTTVEITDLSASWLPVPFPAVGVEGLSGSWNVMPLNRTVVGENGATQGQSYVVETRVPEPTLDQIRAADANPDRVRDTASALPDNLPEIIAQTAREITAGTTNDYDALIAMQSWFRGSDFRYSLDAPVEQGFDGSGADAVAAFLEVKSGYCVHFASAFALMARTLDMPSRIVVGYLPGVNTSTVVDGQNVRSVLSGQLHAWPEVYFDGIGWVAFEPTNSLGTATRFGSATDAAQDDTADPTPTASSTPSATPQPTRSALSENLDTPNASVPLPLQRNLAAFGWGAFAVGMLALLAAPGVVAELRRRRLLASAARGDAVAAWAVVRDTAADLGIRVAGSDTPRMLGDRLVRHHGVDADAMAVLVSAIERESYALAGAGTAPRPRPGDGGTERGTLAQAAREVRGQVMLAASPARRSIALVAPRSLVLGLFPRS
ncbi:DUF3488 and transglutaminase-like domain-containing protein [Microbacterium sp. 67-17]|uniref:transglutaminase family protein n=1 Tax=Microbacterium sp. 67-17 TaxID=1895782 RepID=UPI000AF779F0|nr:DUF3488 and transglutaminase-like domain-containing protein [Microbacterium sp. 67-17]